METTKAHVPNISCGHCVATIKRELGDIPGVHIVDGDPGTKQIAVEWQEPATWEQISDTLTEIGFPTAE